MGETTGASTTQSAESGGEAEAETAEPPKFDLAVAPDFSPDDPSVIDCSDPPPPTASCSVGPPDGDIEWVRICIPPDPSGDCLAGERDEVVYAIAECLETTEWTAPGCRGGFGNLCDAVIEDAQCCYWQGFTGWGPCPGRPLLIDGRERVAALVRREDWCAPAQPCARADAALARAWLFDARNEHAAIASFARFAMQLL
ncbi:MAG TPA: hypothetical protein VG755_28685, partial [Nannocystaceae bacterium]|nr:hypothetical protein [Nannocystaceae bacterium]